jgi:hypothetical protein
MHRLPSRKLSFPQEQKAYSKPLGNGKILPMVQKAHRAQGNKVKLHRLLMGASYNGSTTVSKTVSVGSIPTAPAKRRRSKEKLTGRSVFWL